MRLIDADALIPKGTKVTDDVIAVHNAIRNAPTIEAEPVRHGEWHIFRDGCVLLAECYECGAVQSGIDAAQWDYCPMCGCRMDGDSHD